MGSFLGSIGFGVVLDLTGDGGIIAWVLAYASSGVILSLGP